MNNLIWSVRREIWENRSIYLAPLVVSGIVLIGFFIGLPAMPSRLLDAMNNHPGAFHELVELPYVTAAIILMAVQLILSVFYCLDALYGERRDRSVLFWKSMPVSDVTAVVAKASIPILLLPFVTFLCTVATQAVMLIVSSMVMPSKGVSASTLWSHMPLLEASRINFVHLLGFHGITYAPLYAWLLLVSAWAPRLPFLWATLPPIAIGVIERVAFNSSFFATMLQTYFLGSADVPSSSSHVSGTTGMTMEMMAVPLTQIAMRPSLWIGLAVSAVFLLGAVRLRRVRGPI